MHDYLYYFNNERVVGVRSPAWKYVTHTYYTGSLGAFEKFDQLPGFEASYDLLFDARGEDGEAYSLADRHPAALAKQQGGPVTRARHSSTRCAVATWNAPTRNNQYRTPYWYRTPYLRR